MLKRLALAALLTGAMLWLPRCGGGIVPMRLPVAEEALTPDDQEAAEVDVDEPDLPEGCPTSIVEIFEKGNQAARSARDATRNGLLQDGATKKTAPAKRPQNEPRRPVVPCPPFTIVWEGAEQILAVARHEGIRIVALGPRESILYELVVTEDGASVRTWSGSLSGFSTRCRVLPAESLAGVTRLPSQRIEGWMLLIPKAAQTRYEEQILDALSGLKVRVDEVSSVDVRFDEANGCRLRVCVPLVRR